MIGNRGLAGGGSSTTTVNIKHAGAGLTGVVVTMARSRTDLVLDSMLMIATPLSTRQMGGTTGSLASNVTTPNWLRLAVKVIPPHTWLPSNVTALPLELVDADRW